MGVVRVVVRTDVGHQTHLVTKQRQAGQNLHVSRAHDLLVKTLIIDSDDIEE